MKINELDNVCAPEKQDRINEFCEWCCEQLGIDVPHLRMAPKNDTTALGYTDMSDGSVTIVVGDRHQMDIMRTLAHELVHVRQMGSYEPDGATGSDDENEANAMAGVLMREWGQNNPDLYTEGVNVEEGKNKGLWHNMHAKRKRGEKPAKKGDKAYPKTLDVDEARLSMKKKKPSAQDRFNARLKDKHGIDLDANLAKYKEMMDRLSDIDSGAPKTKADESFGEPSADARKRAAAAQQKNIDDKYVATVDSNSKAGIYKNTSEGIDKSSDIYQEYLQLRKMSVKQLRNMVARANPSDDVRGYDKAGAMAQILRDRHGNRKVNQAMGFGESDKQVDEVSKNTSEDLLGKFKKAVTQKKKDAEYDKKNTAYQKRSDARTDRATELDLRGGDRVANGDPTSLKNPSRRAHNKRTVDKSTSRYKDGYNLPRLPESVDQVDEAKVDRKTLDGYIRAYATLTDPEYGHYNDERNLDKKIDNVLKQIEKLAGKKVRDQVSRGGNLFHYPRHNFGQTDDPMAHRKPMRRNKPQKGRRKATKSDKELWQTYIKHARGDHKLKGKLPEEVEQAEEGVFSNIKKARTQKKKDAEYDKKNDAFKQRSKARDDKSRKTFDKGSPRDPSKPVNPTRQKYVGRMMSKSLSNIGGGNKLPRLPEEVEQVDEGSAAKYTKDEKFLIKHLAKEIRDYDPYAPENDDPDGWDYDDWGETPQGAYEKALDDIEKIAGKKVRDQLETDYKPRLRYKVKSDHRRSSQFSQKSLRDYGTKNTKKVRASAAAKKKFKKAIKDRLGAHKKAMMGKLPESVEHVDESKTARMMALITALGATYGLEDEARAFADQIQQNIHNAQTAEPNPGRPDPVTPGNMKPGSDRVMRPPVDEIAPAIAAVGRGVAKGVGAVAKGVGSMAKTAGTKMAINKMQKDISDDEANEASTTSKILKGAPGAPDGRPKSMREAVNVQSIKDEVMGAVRSGNPREMKRIDDTIAKRISDLLDLRGTAGKEVDAEIITALPVLKKAQMMLRDKQKMSEEKTRIDKKCWKGKKIGNPKTKVKGGVRVNNCVPKE